MEEHATLKVKEPVQMKVEGIRMSGESRLVGPMAGGWGGQPWKRGWVDRVGQTRGSKVCTVGWTLDAIGVP